MIEEVDPADTDKLDEIEVRVECFLRGITLVKWPHTIHWPEKPDRPAYTRSYNNMGTVNHPDMAKVVVYKRYTRSRDALKAIRPDGCYFRVGNDGEGTDPDLFVCEMYYAPAYKNRGIKAVALPTEELAELHAIIQAIAYERGQVGAS